MQAEEYELKIQMLDILKGKLPEEIRQLLLKKLELEIKENDSEAIKFSKEIEPTLWLTIDNSDLDFESRYRVWYYFYDTKVKLQKTPNKNDYPMLYKFFTYNDVALEVKKLYTVDDILAFIDKNISQYRSGQVCDNRIVLEALRNQDDVKRIIKMELMSKNLWSFIYY